MQEIGQDGEDVGAGGATTNEGRRAAAERRRRGKIPRGGPLMRLGTWSHRHGRRIVGAPADLLRETEAELTERLWRATEQPDNARTRAKTRWLAGWLARVRGELARARTYRGGVALEALDVNAPGPSARFPRLSAVVAIDALDLVGEIVSDWLARSLPSSPEIEGSGCRHVLTRYDLRIGREAIWCSRCGRRTEVEVPSIDVARHFCPRMTPAATEAYARTVLDFLRAHASCDDGRRARVGSILAGVAALAQRSLP